MAKSAVAQRVAAPELGRSVFGIASIAFGAFVLATIHHTVLYASVIGLIAGGFAIQWRGATRWSSVVLLASYALYCLFFIPPIAKSPLTFAGWGDLFEPLTMVAASLVVLRMRTGLVLFFLCVASFAAYQAVNPVYTATLVPKWIPPGQMFWVIATTVAFSLAAIALLVRRVAAAATYLLTLMLLLFQVLIWIPAIIARPHSSGMWAENTLNFAIAASCWVVADFLSTRE